MKHGVLESVSLMLRSFLTSLSRGCTLSGLSMLVIRRSRVSHISCPLACIGSQVLGIIKEYWGDEPRLYPWVFPHYCGYGLALAFGSYGLSRSGLSLYGLAFLTFSWGNSLTHGLALLDLDRSESKDYNY